MQPDLTTLRLRGTRVPGNARPNGENSFWNTFIFDVLHNVVNNIHGILRIGEIESFWWAEISIYQVVNNLNPFYFYLSHFIPPFTNFNRFDPISFGQYSSFFSYLMGYKLERKASFVYFDEIIRSIIDVSPWFLVIWADFKSLKASPPHLCLPNLPRVSRIQRFNQLLFELVSRDNRSEGERSRLLSQFWSRRELDPVQMQSLIFRVLSIKQVN